MTLADYLLRANVCLAGLFGLYWLLFRRHTFFALNRAYLLLTVMAAALLPLVELPTETVEAVNLPTVYLPGMVVAASETPVFSLTDALLWGYGLGMAVCMSWLLLGLWRVARLIASGERVTRPGYTLVLVDDSCLSPFSFFGYLVMSRADYDPEGDKIQSQPTDNEWVDNPIFRHELVHIRQWHSADVLLAEVVKCLCWCNPMAWWLSRALQQTHEFLADQSATNAALPPADYARFLVGYALGEKPMEARTLFIANSFAEFSQLKNRIIMLKTNPTNRRAMWLYVLALPLVALLTSLVADRYPASAVEISARPSKPTTVSGFVTDKKGGPLPGANIVVMGGTKGTNTDAKGRFELTNIAANTTLVVSFVGFKSEMIKTGSSAYTIVVVRLKQTPTTLKGTTITPYPASVIQPADSTPPLPPSPSGGGNEIFTVVEQQPEYPGGMGALSEFLSQNLRYPAKAAARKTTGQVFVQFIVSKTGEVIKPRVLKGIGNGCDEEALRVVRAMPLWLPGKQSGIAVAVMFNLPINFREPIYFLDGVELRDSKTASTIDQNTIESISVLKGASATVYGPKAINGVVLITTKKLNK